MAKQNSKQVIIILVIGVMVLCMMYILHQTHNPANAESKYESDLKQYTEALNEATKLIGKLKSMASGDGSENLEVKPVPFVPIEIKNNGPNSIVAFKETKTDHAGTKSLLKDLVVGMAQDTDPRNLVVFCSSLREQNKEADVVIFINTPIAAQLKEITSKFNIITVPFNLQRLTTDVANPSEISKALQKYHPSTTRWSLIYNYLIVSIDVLNFSN